MSAFSMLVKNIIDSSYYTLPTDVVEATKKQILDTLAATVAGSMAEDVRVVIDLVKEWGGKEESTIIGYGGRVPSPSAALANGTLAAVLDYDDVHDTDYGHISRAIIPAALAIAEHKGALDGKELIVAVALGFDLTCRISRASKLQFEIPFCFCIPNFFGAAATASKILNLSEEKLINALGIALHQINTAGWNVYAGPSTKGTDGGFAAEAGVRSALMAERGMNPRISDPLEGKRGFYNTFRLGIYTPHTLTVDLGKAFAGVTNSQKPYPCCRNLHSSVDATLAVVNEYDIKPDDIAEVTAHFGAQDYSMFEGMELEYPVLPVQAQFSLRWVIASAILHRKVKVETQTGEALRNMQTLEMARRIVGKLNIEFNSNQIVEPVIIEIKTKGGQVYSKRVDIAYGSPKNPMSFEDVIRKFKECCRYSVKPLSQESLDKVVQMVRRLEDITDVNQIIRLLS